MDKPTAQPEAAPTNKTSWNPKCGHDVCWPECPECTEERDREDDAKAEAAPAQVAVDADCEHDDGCCCLLDTEPHSKDCRNCECERCNDCGERVSQHSVDERGYRLCHPKCALPPAGWRCTRSAGHEGPCAAEPIPSSAPQIPDDLKSRADTLWRYSISSVDHLLNRTPYGDIVRFSEAAAAIRVLEGKLREAEAALAAEQKKNKTLRKEKLNWKQASKTNAETIDSLATRLAAERERAQQAENKGWNDAIEAASRAASSMTYNGDYYTTYTDHFDSGVRVAEKAIRALSRTEAQPKDNE